MPSSGKRAQLAEMIIIDVAERLTATALELLRDRHDRTNIALILIGMPGLDKRFSHYPQLDSRLGFAHQYRALTSEEMIFVLQRQWKRLVSELDPDDFTDSQAIAAVQRVTRGNFGLLELLTPQVQRVLKIDELTTIAGQAARN